MEKEKNMNLSEKLVYLRKRERLTQMELAEKLNVSRQAVSRWEVGAAVPTTENLKILSELYEVTVDYLLIDGCKKNNIIATVVDRTDSEQIHRYYWKVFVSILAYLLAVLVFFLVGFVNTYNQDEIIPLEDMNYCEESGRTKVTFSLE